MKLKNLPTLISSIIISLSIGMLSELLTNNSAGIYQNLNLPRFAPPSFAFPVIWTILYILMGISSYIVYESNSPLRAKALSVYGAQLIFNFIWPLIFFGSQIYLLACVWILFLWILVLWMIMIFYNINPWASYLQIPYILWLTFAAYLNFAVFSLN